MTDPTNAVSSEAPSTSFQIFSADPDNLHTHLSSWCTIIPKSRTFFQWMHACAVQERNGRSFPHLVFLPEQNQSLPYNIPTITRQQKFAHTSSRTVNKTVWVNLGFKCPILRRIRGIQVEAVGEVLPHREGLTGFLTTSTGNSRYANWDQGRHICLSQLRLIALKLFYSGAKTKAGRAQQNLREVLTRSSI